MEYLAAITVLIILCSYSVSSQQIYRLCSSKYLDRDCNVLNTGSQSEVRCVTVEDSVDCALKLQNNEVDFGVFAPEDALLASKFINNNVQVIYETVTPQNSPPVYKFQTVVVVRSNHSGGLQGLKGTRYCHPGFTSTQLWTDRVLKELEHAVASPSCNARGNRSAVEEELYSLTQFFSSACRPGKWAISDYLDRKYKSEYPQLCSLCDDKTTCSYNPALGTDEQAALNCLTSGRGDVAYLDLQTVKTYFDGQAGTSNFSFLCRNGSLSQFDSQEPCAWVQQRWNSIVARTSVASALAEKLTTWIPIAIEPRALDWSGSLKNILLPERSYVGKPVIPPVSLVAFVEKGRQIPTVEACRPTVRWCTVSAQEATKCTWLREAGITHSIVPAVQCVSGTSKFDCFSKIQNGQADIVGMDSNLGYIALESYNLTSAAYQETTNDKNRVIVAVVRQNTTATRLDDLIGQRICFPQFGGLAWIAYTESLRKASLLRDGVCPHGKTVASLFSSVCAPGANDTTHDTKQLNKEANLCAFCEEAAKRLTTPFSDSGSGTCTASEFNPFYGDAGALRCLHEGGADLAFIEVSNLPSIIAAQSFPSDQYRIFCQDGRKVTLTNQLPEGCAFADVIGGDIVASGSRSRALSRDINNMLLEFDEWFGYVPRNDENAFHLFREFNGTSGLLLENGTIAVLNVYHIESTSVSSYSHMKKSAIMCHGRSTVRVTNGTIAVLSVYHSESTHVSSYSEMKKSAFKCHGTSTASVVYAASILMTIVISSMARFIL